MTTDKEKNLTPSGDISNDKKNDSGENEDSTSKAELLNALPPEAKRVLEIGMMSSVGPMPNPITQKITEKHIDKILDLSEKDEERSFKDAKETRKYNLIYLIVFSALFIFSTVFLVNSDKELYKEAIKLFVAFLGGLGSGFGIKSHIDQK